MTTFLANIYAPKGQVVTVRYRSGSQWYTGTTWSTDETAAQTVTLNVTVQENNPRENFYSKSVVVPIGASGSTTIEYQNTNLLIIGTDTVSGNGNSGNSSGMANVNPTCFTLIRSALRLVGEQRPDNSDLDNALEALNMILSLWQAQGLTWLREEITFPADGSATYTVGPTGTVVADRSARIYSVTYNDTSNRASELTEIDQYAYQRTANKALTGQPYKFYYRPTIPNTELSLYPVPTTGTVTVSQGRNIAKMVSDTDTYDIPPEWLLCLRYAIAQQIAPEYGVALSDQQVIAANYLAARNSAEGSSYSAMRIQPNSQVV